MEAFQPRRVALPAADEPSNERPRLPQVTSPQLKDLRQIKIAVIHPDDADGRLLTQQLQRIGCQVRTIWPPMQQLPEGVDVVFLAVRPDYLHLRLPWAQGNDVPAVIAVVTYENPTMVSAVLELKVQAVLPTPLRSFGLLSSLVVARKLHKESRQQQQRIAKLQTKLLGQRRVADAKAILMRTHQVTEDQAYDLIREQAMRKRSTVEDIAGAIVNADEILSLGGAVKAQPR